MDVHHFDIVTKTLAATGTRRGLLRLLTALPIGARVAPLLDQQGALAKRKGNKGSKDSIGTAAGGDASNNVAAGNERGDVNNTGGTNTNTSISILCEADSPEETCAGMCGMVPNTCGQEVDCGTCPCDPDCAGKARGADDGCGTPCATGACPSGETCEESACCTTAGAAASGTAPCCSGLTECADGVCLLACCAVAPTPCTANTDCCSGVCTCGSNPEAGFCQGPFSQDFSSNADGWYGVTASGGVGEASSGDFIAFTRWGATAMSFPRAATPPPWTSISIWILAPATTRASTGAQP